MRNQEEGALGQFLLGGEGTGDDVDKGQHTEQSNECNQNIEQHLHRLIARRALFQGTRRTDGVGVLFLMDDARHDSTSLRLVQAGFTEQLGDLVRADDHDHTDDGLEQAGSRGKEYCPLTMPLV